MNYLIKSFLYLMTLLKYLFMKSTSQNLGILFYFRQCLLFSLPN